MRHFGSRLEGSPPLHRNDPSRPKPRPTSPDGDAAGVGTPRRGDEIEVEIEKLVFGGDGLARKGRLTVFVPFAAPGDKLRVSVVEARKNFVRGEIAEVLAPGPDRRAPRCRHFGVCGGCHLQHVAYPAQAAAKAAFVRESLRRIGHIEWTAEIPVRTGPEFGWRARAEIQARRGHVGYFRGGTHEIVDVQECPILVPQAEAFLLGLHAEPPNSAVHIAVGDDGTVASGALDVVRQRIAGLEFEIGAQAFSQANRALAETLVQEATGGASGELAVDLYAGAGLFSLPLGRSFAEVIAVESWRGTARQGEANAVRNGIKNVRFAAEPVETWVAQTAVRPGLVLLDPPRTGAGPVVVEAITKLGAPNVTYVSCDPATLARDAARLAAGGYRATDAWPIDLMPQTAHVEVVLRLVRDRA